MAIESELILYLRDCFREDGRSGGLLDVFHREIQHRHFVEREILLSGKTDRLPILSQQVLDMAKSAQTYQRERSLFYGVGFVSGWGEDALRGKTRLCGPLLLYPARLLEGQFGDEFLYATIDIDQQRINTGLLAALVGDRDSAREKTQSFLEGFPVPPFSPEDWTEILQRLITLDSEISSGSWAELPGCRSEEHLRHARSRLSRRDLDQRGSPSSGSSSTRSPQKSAIAAGCLALVPNSRERGGILFELEKMAATSILSAPVRCLLGEPLAPSAKEETEVGRVPVDLSHSQQRAVDSCRSHPLTLISGPPGTGKSLTLAAIALEHLSRGQSVLIASRGQQALDVVCDKVGMLLGTEAPIVRAGRSTYLKDLKSFLEDVLRGTLGTEPGPVARRRKEMRRLAAVDKKLQRLEKRLRKRSKLEQRFGEVSLGKEPADSGWLASVTARLLGGYLSRYLARRPPHWRKIARYEDLLAQRAKLSASSLRDSLDLSLRSTLKRHRKELMRFEKGLRARVSARQQAFFSELSYEALLQALPLWTVTFSDIHRVLPFQQGMFDLVLIDEATQCDMAGCLPVLQRGRRAAVTGDAKQLHHISFLAGSRQRALARRQGLSSEQQEEFDYRGKSLLDRVAQVIEDQDQIIFLNEHFRSAPQIIAFSNRHFYGGGLRIMTSFPRTLQNEAVRFSKVLGRRDTNGVNEGEVEALLVALVERVNREQGLPAEQAHTLGVLSPFRGQVERLQAEVERCLTLADLEKHRILVGTPFSFQGEERDVMFLSLAVDPDSPAGALRYLDRADVFNVAVTRARSLQWIFHSLGPGDAPRGSLLQRFLGQVPGVGTASDTLKLLPVSTGSDQFLGEVAQGLEARGLEVWPAYSLAGITVDLVVTGEQHVLGIDLIGFPGDFAEAFDLYRCRILLRAGLPVFPLPLSAWRRDASACLEAVEQRLSQT